MSNSKLVKYTKISPNRNINRKYEISRISIHCVVGQCSIETLGNIFASTSAGSSSNYGIGPDGRVGMYCEEKDRSWCTSSYDNDHRAVTIEVASDTKHPYAVKDKAYEALLDLCEDICRRNNKKKVIWIPNKTEALKYVPAKDEILLTVHQWFANKSCPGEYLLSRHEAIAKEVTKRLNPVVEKEPEFKPYQVKVTVNALNIRKGPSTKKTVIGVIRDKGVYTIVKESTGTGAKKWGLLKKGPIEGSSWISLDYTKKINR